MVPKKLKEILSSEKPRILIIDDHSIVSYRYKEMVLMHNKGALVSIATSYEHATCLLEGNQYDLIFLDNSLPLWSDSQKRFGTTFIPVIRETSPECFILFISMNIHVAERLFKQGEVDYFVDKPLFFELLQELEKVDG